MELLRISMDVGEIQPLMPLRLIAGISIIFGLYGIKREAR